VAASAWFLVYLIAGAGMVVYYTCTWTYLYFLALFWSLEMVSNITTDSRMLDELKYFNILPGHRHFLEPGKRRCTVCSGGTVIIYCCTSIAV